MMDTKLKIELRTSPHLKQAVTVEQIMRNVVYALLPVCAFAVYAFGISVLALLMVTTLTCILTESLFCRLAGQPDTLNDWSITITGLLLALTAAAQPAIYAVSYALARLWMHWGVAPEAMLGHSVGEYVAACVADVFSLEDGLRLIAGRANLMQQLPRGGAMAVSSLVWTSTTSSAVS